MGQSSRLYKAQTLQIDRREYNTRMHLNDCLKLVLEENLLLNLRGSQTQDTEELLNLHNLSVNTL